MSLVMDKPHYEFVWIKFKSASKYRIGHAAVYDPETYDSWIIEWDDCCQFKINGEVAYDESNLVLGALSVDEAEERLVACLFFGGLSGDRSADE